MRRTVVATAAVVAVTGCVSLAANGLLDPRPADPHAPSRLGPAAAAAAGLERFTGCEPLLDWYVSRTLPRVGPYGLEWPRPEGPLSWPATAGAESAGDAGSAVAGQRDTTSQAVRSSATGTNVQEIGVDEPDVAKTDGELVVSARAGRLVVTDVTGADAREVGRLRLPDELFAPELLLTADRVLVLQSATPSRGGPVPVEPVPEVGDRSIAPPTVSENTRLLEVSIEDPTAPRVVSDQLLGGSTLTARQYGTSPDAVVRLVLRTTGPALDFVQPNRNRTASEAKAANKEIVRTSSVEDWLPSIGSGDDRRPLVDCADVSHPDDADDLGTTTVVSLPADDPTAWRSTAVTAGGETVYSSTDRLYLATRADDSETQVHAFALDGAGTRHVASGVVPGSVRDRWSMDERDGVLRVAVAHGPGWRPKDNGIITLREDGDELVRLGSVRGLGPDEEIKSVRWFDDVAVVVTFRLTDPLYTVDLRDPTRPRALGELKIPGFSRYLHPIGDDRLLGIGQDATLAGEARGAQAAVFDVRDLTDPRRLSTFPLGDHTGAAAEEDPRAFTWVPDRDVALTPVTDHWHGGSRLVALRVSPAGDLTEVATWRLPRWRTATVRTLPLDDGRLAVVAHTVRVVSVGRAG
jgi:hypothetical protein